MAMNVPTYKELLNRGVQMFRHHFESIPDIAGVAPGCVNLIGGQTDYNEGYVLPMALPMFTIIMGKLNNFEEIRLVTEENVDPLDPTTSFDIPLKCTLHPGKPQWANYVKGVVQYYPENVPGFDAIIVSSIPAGCGLSSSTALAVATCSFLEGITGTSVNSLKKADICQKAEQNFVNMPCSITNHLTSIMGVSKHLLLIDCRSYDCENVPVSSDNIVFLITTCKVESNALEKNKILKKRGYCEYVAKHLSLKSLRFASFQEVNDLFDKGMITEKMLKCAQYVIKENIRVCDAVAAIKRQDHASLGLLMSKSYFSLMSDFGLSCPELESLVGITMKTKGVYGSRITGAGIVGCTISLVQKDMVSFVIDEISNSYKFSRPDFIIGQPSQGTQTIKLSKITQECKYDDRLS